MAHTIRRVDYFKTTVRDKPGEAYQLLSILAELGVNLLAISMVPIGPMSTQMTLFPEESARLTTAASGAKLPLEGPQRAIMIHGEDVLGALVDVHAKLASAGINVYASNGISDGKGRYCYILHVRGEDFDRAAKLLEV